MGYYKLNTNVLVSTSKFTGRGILWDIFGKVIFAFHKEFGDKDVLVAKTKALLTGLQFIADQGLKNIVVEVDSQALVMLLLK